MKSRRDTTLEAAAGTATETPAAPSEVRDARAPVPTSGLITDLNGDLGISHHGGTVLTWVDQSPTGNVSTATIGDAAVSDDAAVGHTVVELSNNKLVGSDIPRYDQLITGAGCFRPPNTRRRRGSS